MTIPDAQYKAMRRICDPMIDAARQMSAAEIVLAMQGLYATTETNCPWFAFGLRHTLPGLLAVIGAGKEGYEDAWNAQGMEARQGGDEGSVHDSPVVEDHAPDEQPLYPASAIEAAQIAARNDALEEAVEEAEAQAHEECEVAETIAAAIRSLRTPSQHQEEQ